MEVITFMGRVFIRSFRCEEVALSLGCHLISGDCDHETSEGSKIVAKMLPECINCVDVMVLYSFDV